MKATGEPKCVTESCPKECEKCKAKVTTAQLKTIFSGASDAQRKEVADAFNDAYEAFEINSCLRKAHFFAQVREEVGTKLSPGAENMNYDVAGLKKQFSYFRKNPKEADKYGRTAKQKADQKAIANRAYADRMGNGDVKSGDGWKYRGKGFIQLTGKDNYTDVNSTITELYPNGGVDIVTNADDIKKSKGGMVSAMAYWNRNGLNAKADEGSADSNVDAVTKVINSGTDSYSERVEHFHSTKEVFDVDKCKVLE